MNRTTAKQRSLSAALDVAALKVRRERRLQRAEAEIASTRLTEVLATTPGVEAHALAVELSARADHYRQSRDWADKLLPTLRQLEVAVAKEDLARITQAVREIASQLSIPLLAQRDEDIIEALADPSVPFALGRAPRRSASPPMKRLIERLGQPADTPHGLPIKEVHEAVRSRRTLATRPAAGLQLTIWGRLGSVYDHHGILLGDGSVVHFATGTEAVRKRDRVLKRHALVRREPLERFYGKWRRDMVQVMEPVAVRQRRVTGLHSSIVCLRALNAIGSSKYVFLANNCEHFATWAKLGGRRSKQAHIAGYQRRLMEHEPRLKDIAKELARDDIAIERTPLPDNCGGPREDPIWFDLGRAYWSPDAGDVVVWVPMWVDGPAVGAVDQPWRLGALRGNLDAKSWASAPPSVFIDTNWHAALIGVVTGADDVHPGTQALFWLLPDGTCLRERATVADITRPRLAHAAALIEALGSSLIETLNDVHNAVRGIAADFESPDATP